VTFTSLGLSPALTRAVQLGCALEHPNAIQTLAIPQLLGTRDALVCAPTGSGKTLAYALPELQRLLNLPALQAASSQHLTRTLILVPTRELAQQVGNTLRSLTPHLQQALKVYTAHGGGSINPQLQALRGGADILVATPGRLLDLVAHQGVNLGHVECLILDEADRMLDLGFSFELQNVLDLLPSHRRNLLISATLPEATRQLAARTLQTPLFIEAATQAQENVPAIVQRAIQVDRQRRTQLLRHLIQSESWERALVFVATKLSSEIVADKLRRAGLKAEPFHGELSQGKRNQVLADFKAGRIQIVVATDMAARGLDIAELPVVVNFDLPRSTADYIHRIGRTGRAGAAGLAVSFVNQENVAHFGLIQKRHGLSIPTEIQPGFESTTGTESTESTEDSGSTEVVGGKTSRQSSSDSNVVDNADSGGKGAVDGTGGVKGRRPNKKDRLRAQLARSSGDPSGS